MERVYNCTKVYKICNKDNNNDKLDLKWIKNLLKKKRQNIFLKDGRI